MKDVKNYTDDINDARNKLENSLERAKISLHIKSEQE